VHTILQDIDI